MSCFIYSTNSLFLDAKLSITTYRRMINWRLYYQGIYFYLKNFLSGLGFNESRNTFLLLLSKRTDFLSFIFSLEIEARSDQKILCQNINYFYRSGTEAAPGEATPSSSKTLYSCIFSNVYLVMPIMTRHLSQVEGDREGVGDRDESRERERLSPKSTNFISSQAIFFVPLF